MRLSVVINTYNRGPSLRRTLRSLRHQTCDRFEVIVVNGPSTDNTAAVLDEFAGAVRVGHCPEVHLSKSRNAGIALAAGNVVAFLDDDAIPEPTWAADLLAAYNCCSVGGAGGIVYDHTGFRLQYRYAVCDRTGTPHLRRRAALRRLQPPRRRPVRLPAGHQRQFSPPVPRRDRRLR
jgi:glycosyltransferase involved in cell wall biosynthesis